jgi:hypothetical protein
MYLFYYCAGGYIVTSTQVVTICHFLHHSPLSSPLHSWNSFNRSHFHYLHEYNITAILTSHTLSLCPPPNVSFRFCFQAICCSCTGI